MNIWDYIKAKPFFTKRLPHIKTFEMKIIKKNARGNPYDFSKQEKKEIAEELQNLVDEYKRSIGMKKYTG